MSTNVYGGAAAAGGGGGEVVMSGGGGGGGGGTGKALALTQLQSINTTAIIFGCPFIPGEKSRV